MFGNRSTISLTQFRYVDIPHTLQKQSQTEAFDFGLQYRFIDGPWQAEAAVVSDTSQRLYCFTRRNSTGRATVGS